MRVFRLASLITLIGVFIAGCAGVDSTQQQEQQQSQWISLFNGNNLDGWTMVGPGSFEVQSDGSMLTQGGMGLLYYNERPFRDFVLEFDYRANSASANSGVFVRFPEEPDDPWYAVENGYEIQINSDPDADPMNATGAIYDISAHFRDNAKPTGEWNRYRIEVTGQHYEVYVNGEKVNDFFGNRGREGYIGFQNHDPDSEVRFRNIRVMPLPDTGAPERLADLFAVSETRDPIRVLMLTTTHGFRHGPAIDTARSVLQELEQTTEFEFDMTEDVSVLTEENLQQYDLLFFNNSTFRVREETEDEDTEGAVLVSEAQRQAILDFLSDGKGFVGTHAAADAFYGWDEYRELLGGGLFDEHPWTQSVGIRIEDPDNPAVSHFGDEFYIRDEIYTLDENPRWNSRVLASLDMESVGIVQGPADATRNDHPIAWMRNYNGGRVFYTNLGHFPDVWRMPDFLTHLLEGMRVAAGRTPADLSGRRVKEVIADNVWPDDIAVDERGNVWIAELTGKVHRYDAETGETREIGVIPTTDPEKIEHGLYGVEVDPNFYGGEPYVYIYYAERNTFINTLSRFIFRDGEIDLASEEVILRVPTEPHCCHQAGDLEWGPDGTLYLSTGDTGMSETRPSWKLSEEEIQAFMNRYDLEDYHWSRLVDSERTSQNLQDLRGKVLRINKDGSIPKDNPFYGEPGARWEVYAYGFRNPYRIKVDPATGDVHVGVVGPDAAYDYDEYNIVTEGGQNFGWPRGLGRLFHNEWTADQIPNYVPSAWEYTYETGGRSATAGPIYRHEGEGAFPEVFQGKVFLYDWARRWIKWADVETRPFVNDTTADVKAWNYKETIPTKRYTNIKTFDVLTDTAPISMELGPDGAIYVAEFTGFWGPAPGARVTRYRWVDDADEAAGTAQALPQTGEAPLDVEFRGVQPETGQSFHWEFGDGASSTEANPVHTYREAGTYEARLVVTAADGNVSEPVRIEINVSPANVSSR